MGIAALLFSHRPPILLFSSLLLSAESQCDGGGGIGILPPPPCPKPSLSLLLSFPLEKQAALSLDAAV